MARQTKVLRFRSKISWPSTHPLKCPARRYLSKAAICAKPHGQLGHFALPNARAFAFNARAVCPSIRPPLSLSLAYRHLRACSQKEKERKRKGGNDLHRARRWSARLGRFIRGLHFSLETRIFILREPLSTGGYKSRAEIYTGAASFSLPSEKLAHFLRRVSLGKEKRKTKKEKQITHPRHMAA